MNQAATPIARKHALARFMLRLVFRLLYGYRIAGRENLPARGPFLLVSNHESYFDPILVGIGLDEPVSFMAWAALFRRQPFGWLIRRYGAFPVDLERPDVGAWRTALAALRAGQRVVIFPEGGRTKDGALREMREGAARLALHTGAPIVPVRIEGAYEIWPSGRRLPRLRGRLRVVYGAPLPSPHGRLDTTARAAATRAINDALREFWRGDRAAG